MRREREDRKQLKTVQMQKANNIDYDDAHVRRVIIQYKKTYLGMSLKQLET